MKAILTELKDYFIAVGPLALGILSVPPLTTFTEANVEQLLPYELVCCLQFLHSMIPSALLKKSYALSLIRDSTHSSTLTTYASHMFVHGTYGHIVLSLFHLFGLGYPVFREFGGLAMNLLFLGGGIAATYTDCADTVYDGDYLTSKVLQIHNESWMNIASEVFSMKDSAEKTVEKIIPTLHMGASAALWGLSGANLVLLSKDCVLTIRDIVQYMRKKRSRYGEDKLMFYENIGKLVVCLSSIVSSAPSKLLFVGDTIYDGGAAEVVSFLFGTSVTCGLLLVKYISRRKVTSVAEWRNTKKNGENVRK